MIDSERGEEETGREEGANLILLILTVAARIGEYKAEAPNFIIEKLVINRIEEKIINKKINM